MCFFRGKAVLSHNRVVSDASGLLLGGIDMKQVRGQKILLLVLTLSLTLVAACSGNNNGNKETTEPTSTTEESPAPTEAAFDPLAKYDPPIELTTAAFIRDGAEFPQGDSIENNVWTRLYEEQLGIKVKYDWVSSDTPEVRDQKMSVSIASNSLPELISVTPRELQMLVDAGAVEDMTEVYDKYASPLVKENLEVNDAIALNAATFDGKLMAIPTAGGIEGVPMIWVRADWLKNVGLEGPKTMDDVLAIAKAFTEQDPDKNGEKDTFGLAIGKNIYDGFAGVEGFFAGYGAYPYNANSTMWLEKDGKLAYAGVQPEMKEALASLQSMFKAGQIDPEFAVKDGVKVAESVTSGKIGLLFGHFWNASWPFNDMNKQALNADWKPFPLVSKSGAGQPYLPEATPSSYYVVKKGYEHPEAAVKLLNVYYDNIYGDNAKPETYHSVTEGDKKIEVFGYAVMRGNKVDNNIVAHEKVTAALKSGDPAGLNAEYKDYYDRMLKIKNGEMGDSWFLDPIFGEGGAYSIIKGYSEGGLIISNAFTGTPTTTMVERGATLKELEHEMITKVIMNAAPIDEFDQFVANWKKLGGDQITQEVNDWHSSK